MNQQRQYFKQVANRYGGLVAPSFLRLEQSAGTGSSYSFKLLKEDGTPNITERRLDKNDAFVVTDLGFYIGYQATSIEDMVLYTNPTDQILTTNPENLYSVYNGHLSVTINQTVYLEAHSMLQHLNVGVAQDGMHMINGQATTAYTASSFNGKISGRTELPIELTLSGRQKNEIKLDLPTATTINGNATTYLVLMLFGFLVTGGADDAAKFNGGR